MTSPPTKYSATSTRKTVREVRIVLLRVWFTLSFITVPEVLLGAFSHVLPDAVEDDHRIVDGKTNQGQEGRDNGQGEFPAQKGNRAEGNDDVVNQGQDAPDGETELITPGDIDQHPEKGETEGQNPFFPQVLAGLGSDRLRLPDFKGALSVRGGKGVLESSGDPFQVGRTRLRPDEKFRISPGPDLLDGAVPQVDRLQGRPDLVSRRRLVET